jgi:hypothetical protein
MESDFQIVTIVLTAFVLIVGFFLGLFLMWMIEDE